MADQFDLPPFDAPVEQQAQQLILRQSSGRRIDLGLRSQAVQNEFDRIRADATVRRQLISGATLSQRGLTLEEAQSLSGFTDSGVTGGVSGGRNFTLAPQTQSFPAPNQSFASLSDLNPQTQTRATLADLNPQQTQSLIPPPRNTISIAPTKTEQFKEFTRDRNFITGSLAFAGEKTQGFIAQREVRGGFGFSKGGQSLSSTGLISTTTSVAPFFIPGVAPALLVGTGVAQVAPSGLREAKNVGLSLEQSKGIPRDIGTVGFLGTTTGLGVLGAVGGSRQLSRIAGLPKTEVQVLGVTSEVKAFPSSRITAFDTAGTLNVKPNVDNFRFVTKADALVITKSNIFLPAKTSKVSLTSESLIGKPLGSNLFQSKTVFKGTSQGITPGLRLPGTRARTIFGKQKDFAGVSTGNLKELEVIADAEVSQGNKIFFVSAKGKGVVSKDLVKLAPIDKTNTAIIPTGKVKSSSIFGDVANFRTKSLAVGTAEEVGVVSKGTQLAPAIDKTGVKALKTGSFKSEGLFKLKKPDPKSNIVNVGKGGSGTTQKTKQSLGDMLQEIEKQKAIANIQGVTAPKAVTSSTFKPATTVAAPTQQSRELFRGVPASQFQAKGQFERTVGGQSIPGTTGTTRQGNFNFQPTTLGVGLTQSPRSRVNLSTRQGNLFKQNELFNQKTPTLIKSRQGQRQNELLRTKTNIAQLPKTRQITRTTPIIPPTFAKTIPLTPGIIGGLPKFSVSKRVSARQRGTGIRLNVGRTATLDAIGLNIKGRKAKGELIGAGSLITRPILRRKSGKKKKK